MYTDVKFLKNWQAEGKKTVIYCAGLHGKLCAHIFQMLGIRVDFFVDNDEKKWNTEVEGIKCCDPDSLAGRKEVIVFICVALKHYQDVLWTAKRKGILQIAEFTDILDDIILHDREKYLTLIKKSATFEEAGIFYCLSPNREVDSVDFTNPVSERIAVYTGIFGGYDEICYPQIQPQNIDYYFISDEEPAYGYPFQWIDAKKIIPDDIISPIKRNRYIKMHAHDLFPQYRYSIYMDGNITLTADISGFIPKNRSGISAFMLPWRDCVYFEALAAVNDKRVAAGDVCRQMERYLDEGMPIHYGLPEMPVIAMEHGKWECVTVMETWWREFSFGAQRDQLSFMYAMWKNGMTLADMTSLGTDVRHSNYLYKTKHPSKSKGVVNTD